MSNVKVHELAKELNMTSKELLDRLKSMGIEAKSHMSVLTEIDAIAVKNNILRSKSGSETKIVKVKPKKTEVKEEVKEEPKVVVKAAVKLSASPATKTARPASAAQNQQNKSLNAKQQASEKSQSTDTTSRSKGNKQQSDITSQQQRPVQRDSLQKQDQRKQSDVKQDHQISKPERKDVQKDVQKKAADARSKTVSQKTTDSISAEQKQQAGKKSKSKSAQSPSKQQSDKSNQAKQKSSNQQQSQQKQKRGGKQQNIPGGAAAAKKTTPPPKPVEPEINLDELPPGTKVIKVPITVAGLAEQIEKTTSQVIMTLMKLGIMANINQNLDEETVVVLGEELGVNIVIGKVEDDVVEEGLELFEDKEEDLKVRAPIIAVMGHVDHGKTSLLDAIRKTNVTKSESGGITQHIGASEVYSNGQKIVFLDTPGHEAFTSMRARGAHATDIAILVVAADDSVKPQTIEAISHAKAANVPIIVAINKIDKPSANLTRVKQDLADNGVLIEEWGGDTICVPVSAKTGEGIDSLLEMILLQAEVMELKANPNRLAMGIVIEARLDKNKGPVATLLVLNGTLQTGMSVVAGTCSGRIKAMTNYKGDSIRKAGPATAVEILGLTDVPEPGDEFNAVREDRIAREIAENRRLKLREEVMARNSSTTLEQLFSQIKEGEIKELNLIIKADVQGSVEALTQSLEKLENENVKVKIIHAAIWVKTFDAFYDIYNNLIIVMAIFTPLKHKGSESEPISLFAAIKDLFFS
jgi:translation initiation factor IF-2